MMLRYLCNILTYGAVKLSTETILLKNNDTE